jgi:hypothetical protein
MTVMLMYCNHKHNGNGKFYQNQTYCSKVKEKLGAFKLIVYNHTLLMPLYAKGCPAFYYLKHAD